MNSREIISVSEMNPARAPKILSATFEDWKVPSFGKDRIPGKFRVEIRLESMRGGSYRYRARIGETKQPFPKTFAERDLEGCQRYVQKQFFTQLTEWE